jgi:hypothetical protein
VHEAVGDQGSENSPKCSWPCGAVDLPERVGIGVCDECGLRRAKAQFALSWGWPEREEPDPAYFYCSDQCLGLAKLTLLARRQA